MTTPTSSDGLYSMRVVTRMTGLTADTIRAWERRYGAVTPDRSLGNTRRFSADDVRRLIALREATRRGHSIGAIANLPMEEIASLVGDEAAGGTQLVTAAGAEDLASPALYATMRDNYLDAVLRFEPRAASDLLHRCATLLPPREFVFNVVIPVVQAVGTRWERGEIGVAQEHLVTAQVSGLIDKLVWLGPTRRPRKILLTTPSGHRHSLGILVAALIVASHGAEAIFLGPDLPDDQLAWAAEASGAEICILSVVQDLLPGEAVRLSEVLADLAERTQVWVGVPERHELVLAAPQARFFHRFEDLDVAISDWIA